MATQRQLFVFGDQTTVFAPDLRKLAGVKNNSSLLNFFERVHLALREEIAGLPAPERKLFPRFSNLGELLARYEEAARNPALDSALSCVFQLACFLNHYGTDGRQFPSHVTSSVTGLCLGSLAASALSVSTSLGELVSAGTCAVIVAFKVGLYSFRTACLIDQSPGESSWSAIVPTASFLPLSAKEALSDFNRQNALPPVSSLYLGAWSANTVSINGPPSVLDRFLRSALPSKVSPIRTRIHSPYHASHLFSEEGIEQIFSTLDITTLENGRQRMPFASAGTISPIQASQYGTLLRSAVQDMLLHPLNLAKLAGDIPSILANIGASECTILPICTQLGSTLAVSMSRNKILALVDNSIMDSVHSSSTGVETQSSRPGDSKIAIIGISGRFPDGPDTDQFWNVLYNGLDVHRTIPPDRFDAKAHYDPTGRRKNTSKILNGCWINEPGAFDAKFFNISPKEAAQADPSQRLALQTAYEALEMAGVVPDATPSTQKDRVGVFYGMTSDDWREVNSGQDVDTYFIPGGNRAFTPGRINYYFKFSGPSLSVDTACSSSLAAIHAACNSLWQNDCDTAVAGGTNIMTNPDNFAGLDRGHFLSTTGNCKTFDDGADGYCRGEAVGTVILKRLEDALADRDPIQAVILGAYTNHSAESVSITRPHVGAQEYIFTKLVTESGIHPHDVSYVEMHGTGTQAGDATEMNSVLRVFAPDTTREPSHTLHLGSAKSNIGHGESASGVTALIKVLLMMEKNTIPPHCGIKTRINQKFPKDLKERNVHIALEATPWQRPDRGLGKRRAFVNNFSAAGGNTALLIEDAPLLTDEEADDPRSAHLIAISAKSAKSLKRNATALKDYVERYNGDIRNFLPKLAYTTTARRMHHKYRLSIISSSLQETVTKLEEAIPQCDSTLPARVNLQTGFVFSGQGAQYAGIGAQLFQHNAQFRSDMLHFDGIAAAQGFPSILPLLDSKTNPDNLSVVVQQLGATCLQMALTKLWISFGVEPAFVLGHSLGEYAAMNAAGALTTSDTIYLTGIRARLLQAKCKQGSHAMLAVKARLAELSPHLDETTHEIACINGPQEIVVSGRNVDIDLLHDRLAKKGLKSTKVKVPYAFHSSQMDAILKDLEIAAQSVEFREPRIPIISPSAGKVITAKNAHILNTGYLSRHCRGAVNFVAGINAAIAAKIIVPGTSWVELGPHSVCSSFLKANLGPETIAVPSLRRNEDVWKVLAGSLSALYRAGANIRWYEYHRDFSGSHEVLPLPAYKWDNKNHWIQYVHDWTLSKGDAPVARLITEPVAESVGTLFSTTSVQRIVENVAKDSKIIVVAESSFSHQQLSAVAKGHKVNGVQLCPSSLYADIAQTLGCFILENRKPELKHYGVEVCNMEVDKPLIVKHGSNSIFRVRAEADLHSLDGSLTIYSVDESRKETIKHAKCAIKFTDPQAWEKEWSQSTYLIKRSIDWLRKGVDDGRSHRLLRGMAYKLFSSLVEYDESYKGMNEVILDSENLEATARVEFQVDEGNFHRNPFWIDSLGHLSGFVMNANDSTPAGDVYVNHGWESMKCSRKFSSKKIYDTYVKMQPIGGNKYSGDVYVFEGEDIVAVYQGVTFQGVSRRILDSVLPSAEAKTNRQPTARPITVSKTGTQMIRPSSPSKPTKKVLPEAIPAQSPIVDSVMGIISEEVGLPISELNDGLIFADYGIDSLLSLNITGRIREELSLDVDSSLFTNCETVGDLKRLLAPRGVPATSVFVESASDDSDSPPAMTPDDSDGHLSETDAEKSVASGEDDLIKQVCAIVSDEMGFPGEEMPEASDLAELGMDSLLSLTVLSRLREELGLQLVSEFFAANSTIADVRKVLGGKPSPPVSIIPNRQESDQMVMTSSPLSQYKASSVLLQGNPKTATEILFLLPDGSGSATSYAPIPSVSPDLCVYGLNCPWLKDPAGLIRHGLVGLSTLYVQEIRRRKASGPYNLGGWSAGGICAYEAALQLAQAGETVKSLILLDSPNPIGLERLPRRFYDFLNAAGVFGDAHSGRRAPSWLLDHFLAFIDALDAYKPVAWHKLFPPHIPMPRASILWAADGVAKHRKDACIELREDDPREMRWLVQDRTNFGPNGWDVLLPEEGYITTEHIEGADHFSMLGQGANAQVVADFLGRALGV